MDRLSRLTGRRLAEACAWTFMGMLIGFKVGLILGVLVAAAVGGLACR
jgi:hypothetical protein